VNLPDQKCANHEGQNLIYFIEWVWIDWICRIWVHFCH